MKNGIKCVFERDLESELRSLNDAGAELIRLIQLPKIGIKETNCPSCNPTSLCPDHGNELYRISLLNIGGVKRGEVTLEVWLPRWALVYKLP